MEQCWEVGDEQVGQMDKIVNIVPVIAKLANLLTLEERELFDPRVRI